MPFNNQTTREDVQGLIPEDVSMEMMTGITGQSAALTMFRSVPISRAQVRMPVLSALPVAYFVTGDTGLKQTTKTAWENKYFNVEEIAAIVPVPENVLDDMDFDFWAAIRPELEIAIGRALDAAVFFGVNKPSSWPGAIVPSATSAGNTVVEGTATPAEGGIAQDVSQLMALLEAEGQDITGAIASTRMRGLVRGLRDTTGQPIVQMTPESWWGVPVQYPMRGLWPTDPDSVEAIIGDFSQALIGVRSDFNWKLLDQAVIQDQNGGIIFNLAQQDMVALRVTARYAYQVANGINYDQADPALRFPFGNLLRPAS